MAYCNKCGAYIPDGHTVCLACGNDIEEKKPQAQTAQEQTAQRQTAQEQTAQHAYDDSANYYSFSNDELRRKLEEQRKKQQEQSRKWAEQEKQCRERERESVKDNWKTYTDSSGASYSAPSRAQNTSSTGWNNTRLLSVISYISGLFLIPLIYKTEDRKAGFHARQGLRLFIFGILCDAVTRMPGIGALLHLSRIFLMIKGIINAVNDREEPLPFIGTIGEKKP